MVALTALCRDGCFISIGGLAHDDCRRSTCLGRPLISVAPWHSMTPAVTAPSGNPSGYVFQTTIGLARQVPLTVAMMVCM